MHAVYTGGAGVVVAAAVVVAIAVVVVPAVAGVPVVVACAAWPVVYVYQIPVWCKELVNLR